MDMEVIRTERRVALIRGRDIEAGHVTELRDRHGNPRFLGRSSVNGDELLCWSLGGARLFVDLQAALHA